MNNQTFTEKSIELLSKVQQCANERGIEVRYELHSPTHHITASLSYRKLDNSRVYLGDIGYQEPFEEIGCVWYYAPNVGQTEFTDSLEKAIKFMLVEYNSRAVF